VDGVLQQLSLVSVLLAMGNLKEPKESASERDPMLGGAERILVGACAVSAGPEQPERQREAFGMVVTGSMKAGS
jgi:hypothetical protein